MSRRSRDAAAPPPPGWFIEHPLLAVPGGAAAVLLFGAVVLAVHLATSPGPTATSVRHEIGGDVILFVLYSLLVVGGAVVVWIRIRAIRGERPSRSQDLRPPD